MLTAERPQGFEGCFARLWAAPAPTTIDARHPKGVALLGVFRAIGGDTHEEVLFGADPVSGLRTIIAVHSTALGPALGGTRFFSYENEEQALADVLRLAKAMTYKAAAAGLDLGGGKAVIIGDPGTHKSERLLRSYGRVVDSLSGRYITAEDVGTTMDDMVVIAKETAWVTGLPEHCGGSGDPSPATARGVLAAMRAVARRLWGSGDLSGRTVAVQGVGKVGMNLVERLSKAGATTVVSDVNPTAVDVAVRAHGSRAVGTDEIFDVECDIFAPCAMGHALSEQSIPRLRAQAIVGSANNQLETETDAERLAARDILYAPDFVVNAGGIINIAEEIRGYAWERAAKHLDAIEDTVTRVLELADERSLNPHQAAVELADERIAKVGSLGLRRRAGRDRT
jgi:leucine dehydrogenase